MERRFCSTRWLNCLIAANTALITYIANQRGDGGNREQDVEFDEENEPPVEMVELDENRADSHCYILNELG